MDGSPQFTQILLGFSLVLFSQNGNKAQLAAPGHTVGAPLVSRPQRPGQCLAIVLMRELSVVVNLYGVNILTIQT